VFIKIPCLKIKFQKKGNVLMQYNMEDFDNMIGEDFSFVYITSEGCNVCKVLAPKLEEMAEKFPKSSFHRISLDYNQLAKSKFMAFAIPTLVVYSGGQELLRSSRHVDLYDVETKLTRYYEMIFS
jgi:thiol-disulfide isomerase/thioredoxin